jgi:hypothetical protein
MVPPGYPQVCGLTACLSTFCVPLTGVNGAPVAGGGGGGGVGGVMDGGQNVADVRGGGGQGSAVAQRGWWRQRVADPLAAPVRGWVTRR